MKINQYSRNGSTVKSHKRLTRKEFTFRYHFLSWTLASAFGICLLSALILTNSGIDTLNQLKRFQEAYKSSQHASIKPFTLTKLGETVIRETTAYNLGDKNQTDDSPCIMANGKDGCKLLEQGESICATNAYPLGTKLYIENYGFCTVHDRMNKRFSNRVDIGMKLEDKERALAFGKQKLAVSVVDNQELIK